MQDVASGARPFVSQSTNIFLDNLRPVCDEDCTMRQSTVMVHVKVNSSNLNLDWDTNEQYTLNLSTKGNNVTVIIVAMTAYGARHGLETLSQLTAPIITPDGGRGLVILDFAVIKDKPVFPHRGLLIDTARNFLPVTDILRTIDGLASNKMNVLHWHATDSQSFPLEIKSVPLMTEFGAYGLDKIYSAEDMAQIVMYGKARGVRVILELDSPSHAGAGWEWGESIGYGKLAVCANQQPWNQFCIQPPCGQLNPVNLRTYRVLRSIYKDVLEIWGHESVLHLGGDEVFLPCWNSSVEIISAMQERGMNRSEEDFLKLWGEFHSTQVQMLDQERNSNSISAIVWSSHLTSPDIIENHLDKKRFVIQTWVERSSPLPRKLLRLGYRLIVSTKDAWYLDHGFWGTTTYHTWRDVYNNRLSRQEGVLGGETCMWGEYVSPGSLDARIWPRTAAVAERLWSDPQRISTADAEPRLEGQRKRLKYLGISSDALAPEWCAQHPRQCM
ncbi:chitooligosaccharidolytic beta-N-acetylglucosaminidase isoform X2 [Cephus cinctus]|nr:chitooligosaccharidolytic beta-N-acetylglucosaminidase isoform X2 [Cephus cinctus]